MVLEEKESPMCSLLEEVRQASGALEVTIQNLLSTANCRLLTRGGTEIRTTKAKIGPRTYSMREQTNRIDSRHHETLFSCKVVKGTIRIDLFFGNREIRVRVNGTEVLSTSNLTEVDADVGTTVLEKLGIFTTELRAFLGRLRVRKFPITKEIDLLRDV